MLRFTELPCLPELHGFAGVERGQSDYRKGEGGITMRAVRVTRAWPSQTQAVGQYDLGAALSLTSEID